MNRIVTCLCRSTTCQKPNHHRSQAHILQVTNQRPLHYPMTACIFLTSDHLVRELIGDMLAVRRIHQQMWGLTERICRSQRQFPTPKSKYSNHNSNSNSINMQCSARISHSPGHLLKHPPCLIRHFLIHAPLFCRIDLSLSELAFRSIETCGVVDKYIISI